MKKYLIILIIFIKIINAQSTGRTKAGSLYPLKNDSTKNEVLPATEKNLPELIAKIEFIEPNGNKMLDADETGIFRISVSNIGILEAEECYIKIKNTNASYKYYFQLDETTKIGNLKNNETRIFDIKVKAGQNIPTSKYSFKISVIEKKGFDMEPDKVITIPTNEYKPPVLVVADYGIDDNNRNAKIELKETFDITIRIQNQGEDSSVATNVKLKLGENLFAMDVRDAYDLGTLNYGDFADVKASIATNARTDSVVINVIMTEKSGIYGKSKTIVLPVNKIQKKTDQIEITGVYSTKPAFQIVNSLKLDIAEDIPEASEQKAYAVAVVVGNRNYTDKQVPAVDFAFNDAALIRNYLEKALGYKNENIIYLEDATQADFFNVFGNESNFKGKLYDFAVKGLSEVFIYYSGHGAPDPDSKQGYIVPVDCDPSKVNLNGYSLNTLYSNLDKIAQEKQLKHVTVILDACFSGNTQKGSLLKNISPVYIKVNNTVMNYPNSSVITSTSGDQVSTWYSEKRQSLFTYFFLKGLKGEADTNEDKKITLMELYNYTADEINGVPYWARRINGTGQNPVINGIDYEIFK